MKRFIWMVAILSMLLISTQSYATSLTGDVNTNTNTNTLVGTNTNVNTNANTNLNTNANLNTNLNTQGQQQGQVQGQAQKQSQTAVGKVTTKVSNNTTINNPRELEGMVVAPAVSLPMIQGGIHDYTAYVQNFLNIRKFSVNDIYKTVETYKYIVKLSCAFGYSKIYIEDVEATVINKYNNSDNKKSFRYQVIIEDGSDSASAMIGGGSGISANDGLSNGSITGGIGFAHSGARPTFIVKIYYLP